MPFNDEHIVSMGRQALLHPVPLAQPNDDEPRNGVLVRDRGQAWQVADAVLFVAATAPLDAKEEFLLQPFCEALARWVEEHPETSQADAP
jgi:hypothetical protein